MNINFYEVRERGDDRPSGEEPFELLRDGVLVFAGVWADCVDESLHVGQDDDLLCLCRTNPPFDRLVLGDYRRDQKEKRTLCELDPVAPDGPTRPWRQPND